MTFVYIPSPSVNTIPRVDAPQRPRNDYIFNQLRKLKHLAIIEVDSIEHNFIEQENNVHDPSRYASEDVRINWKRDFIGVLKDSPSRDRKLLRWKVIRRRDCMPPIIEFYEFLESGEMEVFPDASL